MSDLKMSLLKKCSCFCRLRKGKVDEDKEQCLATVTEAANTASPEVARWIEERDILLETGVYTNNDFTIQQLDKKIKAGK